MAHTYRKSYVPSQALEGIWNIEERGINRPLGFLASHAALAFLQEKGREGEGERGGGEEEERGEGEGEARARGGVPHRARYGRKGTGGRGRESLKTLLEYISY